LYRCPNVSGKSASRGKVKPPSAMLPLLRTPRFVTIAARAADNNTVSGACVSFERSEPSPRMLSSSS